MRSERAPEPSDTTVARWPEILLLIGFVVICLVSVLTVLVPSTENDRDGDNAADVKSAVN
jgi:hypothetical protein